MSFVVVAMVSERSSGPCAFLVAPADLGGQPVSGDYRRSSGQADLGRMGVETTLSRANTVKYHHVQSYDERRGLCRPPEGVRQAAGRGRRGRRGLLASDAIRSGKGLRNSGNAMPTVAPKINVRQL